MLRAIVTTRILLAASLFLPSLTAFAASTATTLSPHAGRITRNLDRHRDHDHPDRFGRCWQYARHPRSGHILRRHCTTL